MLGEVFGFAGDDRQCRICSCTQNAACMDEEHGACWWVEPDLCSHCVQYIEAAGELNAQELQTIAAQVFRREKVEPHEYHGNARDSAQAALEHMRADLAGEPAKAITDAVLKAYLVDIGLYAMVGDVLEGSAGGEEEHNARQLLLRLERGIQWVMVPSDRGETMYAVIGSTQTFEKNPRVSYAHALGERIGPIEGIDRAQATVVAEAVHAASTRRKREYQDAKDQAQANGWVVYGQKGLGERAADLLKAAGIDWLSISLGGVDMDGVAIITLKGPVPDELPDGILRQKPGASN